MAGQRGRPHESPPPPARAGPATRTLGPPLPPGPRRVEAEEEEQEDGGERGPPEQLHGAAERVRKARGPFSAYIASGGGPPAGGAVVPGVRGRRCLPRPGKSGGFPPATPQERPGSNPSVA